MKTTASFTILPLSQRDAMQGEFRTFGVKAKAALLDPSFIDYVYSPMDRWDDEREFEDFSDYVKAIRTRSGFDTLKVSRSFTLTLTEGYFTYTAKFGKSGRVTGESSASVKFRG